MNVNSLPALIAFIFPDEKLFGKLFKILDAPTEELPILNHDVDIPLHAVAHKLAGIFGEKVQIARMPVSHEHQTKTRREELGRKIPQRQVTNANDNMGYMDRN